MIAKPEHGSVANVFIGTPLNGAIFKDVSLANASFANVSLAKAKFDDIDFSNSVITCNCNFKACRLPGSPSATFSPLTKNIAPFDRG